MSAAYKNKQKVRNKTIYSNLQALERSGYLKPKDKTEMEFLVSGISLISRFWISEASCHCNCRAGSSYAKMCHLYSYKFGKFSIISLKLFLQSKKNAVFLDEIKRKYNERLNELALIRSISECEGKPSKDLEDQKPEMCNCSVNLMDLTKGKYLGHLWIKEIEYIQQAILKAVIKLKLTYHHQKIKKAVMKNLKNLYK